MGVDIGKQNCVVCIIEEDGSIIEETEYNNTLDQAEFFASYIKRKHIGGKSSMTAVCESTGIIISQCFSIRSYRFFRN